ncbi:MAG UNVERIFIED_CONTAM: hypothetical protein LVR18_39935 [Planctomycetaceae bacterium]
MRHFAIHGDGKFVTKPGFGVFVSLDAADPDALKWPSWMPIQITALGVIWDDIDNRPEDFKLSLSASVVSLYNLPFNVSGAVSDVVIEPSLLADGKFPITGIGALSVSVSGDMFGGRISGSLMGGIVKIDANGNRIPAGSATPVADRVFFVGLEGGFEMPGVVGMSMKLAFSNLGPLKCNDLSQFTDGNYSGSSLRTDAE